MMNIARTLRNWVMPGVLGLALAGAAFAQAAPVRPPAGYGDGDTTRGQIASFDGYLDNHPEVARELARNPGLVNNWQYMANHPGLRQYLANHPGVREELRENPRAFMVRERGYERWENNNRWRRDGWRDNDGDRDDHYARNRWRDRDGDHDRWRDRRESREYRRDRDRDHDRH